jgi:hypothetical protein
MSSQDPKSKVKANSSIVKPVKVKTAEVKPVKAKPVSRATQIDVTQLQIQLRADKTGIFITVSYAGRPIHAFVLSVPEYTTWQRMAFDQKILFVKSKTNYGVFGNNQKIVNMVIRAIINLLDLIFDRVKAQNQRLFIIFWSSEFLPSSCKIIEF